MIIDSLHQKIILNLPAWSANFSCVLQRFRIGEVAERLKAPLSKSGILLKTGSWVRIPPSPPSK